MTLAAPRLHPLCLLAAATILTLAACNDTGGDVETGPPGPASATRSGLPAHDALFAATGLPAGTVYGVARTEDGFRVLYHSRAGSSDIVASNLCATLGRTPGAVRTETVANARELPGARKIAISCSR